jgi:hypothetical protein
VLSSLVGVNLLIYCYLQLFPTSKGQDYAEANKALKEFADSEPNGSISYPIYRFLASEKAKPSVTDTKELLHHLRLSLISSDENPTRLPADALLGSGGEESRSKALFWSETSW